MDKKKIKNIALGAAAALVISTPVVGLVSLGNNVGYNTPLDYKNTARVEYNGEQYKLFSLHKLTSQDGEEHICALTNDGNHLELGIRVKLSGLGFGPNLSSNPYVYVDINSKEVIAVEGYEETMGYQVEKIADLFPFEEYGSREIVVIDQDHFESVVNPDSIQKTI